MVVFCFVLFGRRLVLSAAADRGDALERLLLPVLVVAAPRGLVGVAARHRVDVLGALLLGGLARVVGSGLESGAHAIGVPLLGGLDVLFCLESFLCLDVEGRGPCLRARPCHVEDGNDRDDEKDAVEAHSALRSHGVCVCMFVAEV